MNPIRKYRRPAAAILLAALLTLSAACERNPGSDDLTRLPGISSTPTNVQTDPPVSGTTTSSDTPSATSPTAPGTETSTDPASASTDPQTQPTGPDTPPTAPETPPAASLTLTRENLTALSDSNNVIVFLVDRFDEKYAVKACSETPDVYSELTGFTWFQDHISLFGHTYPAITWMLTNKPYSCEQARRNYLNAAFRGETPLKKLSDAGYTVNIYTESGYSYVNINFLPEYFANVQLTTDPESNAYSTDTKSVYETVSGRDFTLNPGKTFSFIHIAGCHDVSYDENFETPTGEDAKNYAHSVRAGFRVIDRYLQEMKRLGVYDDATIVITGDHGSPISDKREVLESRLTALFVKPSGSGDAPLKRSSAQVSHEDFWATILKSEGLEFAEDYGTSVFDVPEGTNRVRYHRWHTYLLESLDEYVYEINGPGSDFRNWKEIAHEHYDKFLMD